MTQTLSGVVNAVLPPHDAGGPTVLVLSLGGKIGALSTDALGGAVLPGSTISILIADPPGPAAATAASPAPGKQTKT